MIKKEKEPRDAARVLTNLRKCSGCRRGQGEGEGIESRFLLPLAFPSGRCLPNGRSMPPLSGRWQRIQRVVAHRKVNENSTPLHFSRASASSAINNCPPLIVHILLSLSLSLSDIPFDGIRALVRRVLDKYPAKKGKIAPDPRMPDFLFRPSVSRGQAVPPGQIGKHTGGR